MSTVEDRITAALGQHYAVSFGLCLCGWQTTRTKIGESWRPEFDEHQASVITSLPDVALVSRPDPKNPSPALIEAAYIAQDDLSKPPPQWAIRASAEIINEYINAQGHTTVHVLGHPQ